MMVFFLSYVAEFFFQVAALCGNWCFVILIRSIDFYKLGWLYLGYFYALYYLIAIVIYLFTLFDSFILLGMCGVQPYKACEARRNTAVFKTSNYGYYSSFIIC